jgi:hypothetical protein
MGVLHYWKALLFDEHAMVAVRQEYRPWRAIWWFVLAVVFQALPVSRQDLLTLQVDVPRIIILYFAVLLVGWLLSLLLGSRSKFGQYVFTTSAIMSLGGCVMAVLTYLCLFVFELAFNTAAVSNVIVSLIPYYYVVLLAYSSEIAAHLQDQWKRVLLAIVVIGVMYGAYFYL